MFYFKNLRIILVIAGLLAVSVDTAAKAAELSFATTAFVSGTSRINSSSNPGFVKLSNGWYYGRVLSRVADRSPSLGESYTRLNHHGAVNVKNLEFNTFANPARKYDDASSDLRTSTRGNAQLDHITVLVKPTSGEAKGRKVRVAITVSTQATQFKVDGYSGNYSTFYLNGSRKFVRTEKRTGNTTTQTYYVDTTIGQSFTIAVQGISYARKNNSAQQTVTVSMSVPVRVK